MTCREFAEFLDAFLDGSLLAEERASFDRHLAVCTHCVAYLDTYRRTVDACRGLGAPDAQVPADVPDELVRAILSARKKES